MQEKLPVFRAARLVGVSRKTLQEKIRLDGVSTFEGTISVADLLTLYPKADLSRDSEYERIQLIKDTAFARRVRQSVLPDAATLASRLADLGRTLVETKDHLSQYTLVLEHVAERLSIMESGKDNQKGIHELLNWIKKQHSNTRENYEP